MKNTLLFLVFTVTSFLLLNTLVAQNTNPVQAQDTIIDLALTEDLSAYCKPDWEGYDKISPDISTRPYLYPNKKDKQKKKKRKKKRKVRKKKSKATVAYVVN